MIFDYGIVGLGVIFSVIYIVRRMKKEWQGHSTGCSHCPIKKVVSY